MTNYRNLLIAAALLGGCSPDPLEDVSNDGDTGDTEGTEEPCTASELDACLEAVESESLEPCLMACEADPVFDVPCGISACQVDCWISYVNDFAECYSDPNECDRTLEGDLGLSLECVSQNAETNDACLTSCLDGVEIDCLEVFETGNAECLG